MKNTEKWFGELLDSYKNDFDYRLEGLIFELTEQISQKLKEGKITRKKFADALNVSPAAHFTINGRCFKNRIVN